jgi:hypothetical protein
MSPHHRWWAPISTVPIGSIVTIGSTAPTGTLIPTAMTSPTLGRGTIIIIRIIRIATIGPTGPITAGLRMALGGELGVAVSPCGQESIGVFAGLLHNRSMKGAAGSGWPVHRAITAQERVAPPRRGLAAHLRRIWHRTARGRWRWLGPPPR